MKRIAILGSTGSIGTQTIETLEYIDAKVCALTANRNIALLEQQARKLRPNMVAVFDPAAAELLKIRLADTGIPVYAGMNGLLRAATTEEADLVLTAVVGMVGLQPTLAAIAAGKDIALANKETLVCAGQIVMEQAKQNGVRILPVDSEHSAIFQCIQGAGENPIQRIILTASGGPFFGKTAEELKTVTKEAALQHPNWTMGSKITIDSATMMNKGLELIEAMWLYGVQPSQIEIVIHRESILHSAVEFCDNAVIAQLGVPDMRLPIQYALTYPARQKCPAKPLCLADISRMTFHAPDETAFRCLSLAKQAAEKKGNAGAVLNGANEEAVALFLQDKIKFYQIAELVERAMEQVEFIADVTINDVMRSDRLARSAVQSFLK